MTSVDAKLTVRSFKECVKEKGMAQCTNEAKLAVENTATVVARDCDAFAADFFQCYNHKFELSTCTSEVTSRLLQCQANVANQVN